MLKYVHDFVCTYPGESLTTKNTPLPPKKEKSFQKFWNSYCLLRGTHKTAEKQTIAIMNNI